MLSILGGVANDLWSSARGQAEGWMNSERAWYYKKKEMDKSDQLQRAFAKDAPGLVRSGYEAANMNPMLAYSNSAASEAINASGVDSSGPQGSGSAMQAMQLKQQKELNDSTIKFQDDQGKAALMNANTNSARAVADIDNQTKKTEAEITKLIASTDVDKETKRKLIQETALTSHKAFSAKYSAHVDKLKDELLTKGESAVRSALK